MRTPCLVALLLAAPIAKAAAQTRWKEIGKTSAGNVVYVDPHTVKKANGIVSARLRVKFDPPVQTDEGPWTNSQSSAMVNCAKQSIAAKENVYYGDARMLKVVSRKVNTAPGFGPALKGSMGQIALEYLCGPGGGARK